MSGIESDSVRSTAKNANSVEFIIVASVLVSALAFYLAVAGC